MSNNTSSDVSVTQPSDQPVMGTPASVSETPQKPAAVTVEELQARLTELEHSHKNAVEERDRHRKKLAGYEDAEKKAQEAQLSEIERVKKQHAELESKHTTYTQQMQERLVRYEVEKQALHLGIIDPDAAVKLLDWSLLEFEDDGTPKNAKKLLEALMKDRPYLAPVQQEKSPAIPAVQPVVRSTPVLPAMNPGRASITAPGTASQAKIPRLSDPGVLVPPGTPAKYQ